MPSDHAAITLSIDFSRPAPSEVTSERRKLQSIDLQAFLNDLSNTSLVSRQSPDLDDAVSQYDSDLRDLINMHRY